MLNKDPWLNFPSHLSLPSIRSLSLVFILQELVDRFEEIHRLKTDPFSDALRLFFSLESPNPQMGMFPDKLCFYSDILVQASKTEDPSLQLLLDEMRTSILQCRTKLLRKDTSAVSSFLVDFESRLRSFFTALFPFLFEAKTDENVLLTLIELRQKLNSYLGSCKIEQLLQKFFPNGHVHLKAIITEGLTRRGFSSFLAEKESLIDEIEWESPCLMTHDYIKIT